jgi:predicted nucleotidyltransferase component of viral defense system
VIPRAHLTEWSRHVPWPEINQVEQDLVLKRLVVEIFRDEMLAKELAFWGGTCLHALILPKPLRYSEDLDFRRRSEGGIGRILSRLRAIASAVGLEVAQSSTGAHPKVRLRGVHESDGSQMRIKIEMNTREREPVLGFATRLMSIESAWFTGDAVVTTFQPEEIVAAKVRALYQRDKGRDLYDLWLALDQMGLDGRRVAAVFQKAYRPEGFARDALIATLEDRLARGVFDQDLAPLLATSDLQYDSTEALARVRRDVLDLLDA